MRINIEAEIVGNFEIEQDMVVKHHPYTISINFDKERNNFLVSLSRQFDNYQAFIPKIKAGEINSIILPHQSFLFEEIKILQHIESFGSVDKNISRIRWDSLKINWIPETKDEQNNLSINSYHRNLSYNLPKAIVTRQWLNDTVIHRRQLSKLSLPLSFYREGVNLFHSFQYQNAFLNFFILLEGLFGDGQFKKIGLEKEFSKSDILKYAINKTLEDMRRQENSHYETLVAETNKYQKPLDELLVIKHLIKIRGELSHFALNSSKNQRNPLNDAKYDTIAYVAFSICTYSIVKFRLKAFTAEGL